MDGILKYKTKNGKIIFPEEIPTDGLVLYYDFTLQTNSDRFKGKVIDLSGNGYHSDLVGFTFDGIKDGWV